MRVSEKLDFIASIRPHWIERLQPWATGDDAVFGDAPAIPPELLAGCAIVAHRYDLIPHLPKGGVVAEIGTMRGVFAKWILEASHPLALHLFDLEFLLLEREPLADALASGQVSLHEGDSAECLARFPEDHFDWIYVDADHSYDGVVRDIAAARDRVRPGGFLVFDDYCAFSHRELLPYGVLRAVNEFIVREHWPVRYLALDAQGHLNIALARPVQP